MNGLPDEQDVAWALAEEARRFLTIPELNSVLVALEEADYPAAIETMLQAVVSSRASLSSVLVARLGHWIDMYAGQPAEPRLRQYLSRISHAMTRRRRHLRELRLLVDHREDLVAERTRIISRLRWHLHELDPGWIPPANIDRTSAFNAVAAHLDGCRETSLVPGWRGG